MLWWWASSNNLLLCLYVFHVEHPSIHSFSLFQHPTSIHFHYSFYRFNFSTFSLFDWNGIIDMMRIMWFTHTSQPKLQLLGIGEHVPVACDWERREWAKMISRIFLCRCKCLSVCLSFSLHVCVCLSIRCSSGALLYSIYFVEEKLCHTKRIKWNSTWRSDEVPRARS